LITQHSIVTVPWDDAGPYLRFSVTYEAADEPSEDALMATAAERLMKSQMVF
jgi:LL-diaminopimelate aminotransferase